MHLDVAVMRIGRWPPAAEGALRIATKRRDTDIAGLVQMEDRSSAVAREAIAVHENHIDVAWPRRDPFFHDLQSFGGSRKDAPLHDFVGIDVSSFDAKILARRRHDVCHFGVVALDLPVTIEIKTSASLATVKSTRNQRLFRLHC